ncbi:MAG: hypothetical protein EOS73_33895, partial [Mesorhizobium sp.]
MAGQPVLSPLKIRGWKIVKRRSVVVAALAAANSASGASSPFVPFRLEIRRNRRFADLVDLDDCLTGQMFLLGTSAVDPGVYLCDTLELPYRNDQNDISAINPGSFSGRVRTDGARGWRIELDYPAKRLYIQIHSGNVP